MRIGLFALEIGRNVGGLEVYETNLIRALAQVDDINEYAVFCLDPRVLGILNLRAENFSFHVLRTNRFKGVLWDAPRAIAQANVDLFHAMFVPPPFTSIPYVFTHHGTEVIERPDLYPFLLGLRMRVLFRRAFKKAGLILCVSDYVRNYLSSKEGVSKERLRTVYSGCQPEFRPIDRAVARECVIRKYSLKHAYLLTVGRIEPTKNPIRLLKAYDRFRQRIKNPPQLVFAGMKTWSAKEFDRTVDDLALQNYIVELGHVPHDELPALYAASEFAVFASLSEGFGFPALEAFATGTPLITSRTTSLPEISAGASLLVDPTSEEEIAAAMHSLYSHERLRSALRRKGLARAAEFSWQRSAKETVEVYTSLYHLSSRSAR